MRGVELSQLRNLHPYTRQRSYSRCQGERAQDRNPRPRGAEGRKSTHQRVKMSSLMARLRIKAEVWSRTVPPDGTGQTRPHPSEIYK